MVTRSKLNGLVGLLYEHYGFDFLIYGTVESICEKVEVHLWVIAKSCSDGTKFSETEFKRKF